MEIIQEHYEAINAAEEDLETTDDSLTRIRLMYRISQAIKKLKPVLITLEKKSISISNLIATTNEKLAKCELHRNYLTRKKNEDDTDLLDRIIARIDTHENAIAHLEEVLESFYEAISDVKAIIALYTDKDVPLLTITKQDSTPTNTQPTAAIVSNDNTQIESSDSWEICIVVRTKKEYEPGKYRLEPTVSELNELSSHGWELIGVLPVSYFGFTDPMGGGSRVGETHCQSEKYVFRRKIRR